MTVWGVPGLGVAEEAARYTGIGKTLRHRMSPRHGIPAIAVRGEIASQRTLAMTVWGVPGLGVAEEAAHYTGTGFSQ